MSSPSRITAISTAPPRLAIERRNAANRALAAAPLRGEGVTRRVDLVFRRDTTRRPALVRLAASVRAAAPACVRKPGAEGPSS
jgi:hypothetical protein